MSVRNGLDCVVIVSPLVQVSRAARVSMANWRQMALQSRVRCWGGSVRRPPWRLRGLHGVATTMGKRHAGAKELNPMTTNASTDWHEVSGLEDAQQVAWITEHGRSADEATRRDWMRDFMAGTQEQD